MFTTERKIYFQDTPLSDLFTLTPWQAPKPGEDSLRVHTFQTTESVLNKRTNKYVEKPAPCWLSGHVFGYRHRYLKLNPSKLLIDWIGANMLLIDYDTINIEIVCRIDGSYLITAHNSKILGSRWLKVCSEADIKGVIIE